MKMDLRTVKKMVDCDAELLTPEQALKRESAKLWKNLKKRYTYDYQLSELFSEAFASLREFHEWRLQRYPIHRYGYSLVYLYTSDRSQPVSVEQYHWIPKKVWEFFYAGVGIVGKYEYPGIQMSNTICKSYFASIQKEGIAKHLGSAPTALGAHKLWQKAKLEILQDLLREYQREVSTPVLLWMEAWIMTFERNIAEGNPTFLYPPNKEFEE